jgi:hypothetical protein
MEDLNLKANRWLFDCQVGDSYGKDDQRVEVLSRTKNTIKLSNGVNVNIKTLPNGLKYLDSRSVRRGNKPYPLVNQIIRDLEGWFLYKIHSQNSLC